MKAPFQVIYEDNHLLIVNKPSGMAVQPDHSKDLSLTDYLKDYIKEKYQKPGAVFLEAVHRIDKPVSGVVIFGRTSKGIERMTALFRERKIQKTYWAIVAQRPEKKQDRLVHWLHKDESRNLTTAYDYPHPQALKAELAYRIIGQHNKYWLLEVIPITGRPHQIRVQLAAMECPIRGDIKYGYKAPNKDKSINLHARKLYFEHPIKKEPLLCIANLPRDFFWEEFLRLDDEPVKEKNLDIRHEG